MRPLRQSFFPFFFLDFVFLDRTRYFSSFMNSDTFYDACLALWERGEAINQMAASFFGRPLGA